MASLVCGGVWALGLAAAVSAPLGLGVDLSGLRTYGWKEYALRFGFGGAITAITGVIAHFFGPVVGGLFLAFPAILPASVTLVQHHEDHEAAKADAFGAAAGCAGLLAFGALVWLLMPRRAAWLVIVLASIAWLLVAVAAWALARRAARLSASVAPRSRG
jgi:hypothetical protein